ncbi:MAG TPA: SHOCT domain-containing protein [Solirubrobacteraceae bacterium]|nr:SHOCT domain-containing protein [Solirubrobacteraceae bacterium]
MSRVNWIVGAPLLAFFFFGGIVFWVTIPEILIGQIWVAVAVGLFLLYLGIGVRGRRRERLLQQGIRGTATVLGMEQTGVYVNEQPQVRLRLRVEAPEIPAYEVERSEVVPLIALGSLSGGQLSVAIDPADHDKVVIDWSAVAAPMTLSMPDGRVISVDQPQAREAVFAVLRRHGVATSGEADLRDDPAVRRELWEVLERHGYDVDGRTGGPRRQDDARDPVEALEDLAQMRDRKLITEAEYELKKREILGRM